MALKANNDIADCPQRHVGKLSPVNYILMVIVVAILWLFPSLVTGDVIIYLPWLALPCALLGVVVHDYIFASFQKRFIPEGGVPQLMAWALRFGLVMVLFGLLLCSSIIGLLHLVLVDNTERLLIVSVVPVYFAVYLVTKKSSALAVWLTPALMLLIYGLGMKYYVGPAAHASLNIVMEASNISLGATDFLFIKEAADWVMLLDRFRDYALGLLDSNNYNTSLLIFMVGFGCVFFSLSSVVGFCLMPFREYYCIFLPSVCRAELPQMSFLAIIPYISGLVAILTSLYFPMIIQLKSMHIPIINARTCIPCLRNSFRSLEFPIVVSIGSYLFNAQIIIKRDEIYQDKMRADQVVQNQLSEEWDTIFDSYKGSASNYLQWYFGLQNNPEAIEGLSAKEVKNLLQSTLAEYLAQGADMTNISMLLKQLEKNKQTYIDKAVQFKNIYSLPVLPGKLPAEQTMTQFEYLYLVDGTLGGFIYSRDHQDVAIVAGSLAEMHPFEIGGRLARKNVFRDAQRALAGATAVDSKKIEQAIRDSIDGQRQWLASQ